MHISERCGKVSSKQSGTNLNHHLFQEFNIDFITIQQLTWFQIVYTIPQMPTRNEAHYLLKLILSVQLVLILGNKNRDNIISSGVKTMIHARKCCH